MDDIVWTEADAEMLGHIVEVMRDRMLIHGDYEDQDYATVDKLEQFWKGL